MTYELGFIGAWLGVVVFCVTTYMIRHERDAWLGRELRKAAGSESRARMAIESANLDRLLEQKFDRVMAKLPNRLPANVVPFRILNRGQPVRFEPTDGAA